MRIAPDAGSAGGQGVEISPHARPRVRHRKPRPPTEVGKEILAWAGAVAGLSAEPAPDDVQLKDWFLTDVAWAVRRLGGEAGIDSVNPHFETDRRTIRRALDLVAERTVDGGYLSGTTLTSLDLAAAAALAPLARPEGWQWTRAIGGRRSVSLWPSYYLGHPAAAWVRRLYDRHAAAQVQEPRSSSWAP